MKTAMEVKPVAALWQDYLFLTREMRKFISGKPDLDLFLELISQRGRMQEMIEQHPDDAYIYTPAGRAILVDIDSENETVYLLLQVVMKPRRDREKVNKAYNSLGITYSGKRMDYLK